MRQKESAFCALMPAVEARPMILARPVAKLGTGSAARAHRYG